MRGTKAKRLRKEIYGESSKRNMGEYVGSTTRTCAPTSLRAKYLLAKKEGVANRGGK